MMAPGKSFSATIAKLLETITEINGSGKERCKDSAFGGRKSLRRRETGGAGQDKPRQGEELGPPLHAHP